MTSLEELPPLDVEVAARLAEEGGEPVSEPLFDDGPSIDDGSHGTDDGSPAGPA